MEGHGSALVAFGDPIARQAVRIAVEQECARVLGVATSQGALEALSRAQFDVVLLDLEDVTAPSLVSEILRRQACAIIVASDGARFEMAVEAMRLGARDAIVRPLTSEQVRAAVRRVRNDVQDRPSVEIGDAEAFFASQSPVFARLLRSAERAASADCAVLLRGESGTGKNVLARWMHERSPRAAFPFVTVNCPALAGELMASALFGHRRGAFTGAVADVPGKVHEADRGTLFLDEVGDLGPEAQARLLRFLGERTYERVGESREQRAEVRIVAATNRDLEEDVRRGTFRADLLYRLQVVTLTLPPLRERREDVRLLAEHWLSAAALRHGRPAAALSPAALAALERHAFPGNLRELRHAIERAVILAPSDRLEPTDLGLLPESSRPVLQAGDDVTLDELEREHVARVVAASTSVEAAARLLGIDATTLHRKRRRYGLA